MKTISNSGLTLRVEAIQTQINAIEAMKTQANNILGTLKTNLPQARELAFPTDKSVTTQAAKDQFQEYLGCISTLKRENVDFDNQINGLTKQISAVNYIKHQREEAKKYETDEGFKVLVIDLDDINVAPNISIAAIGDKGQHNTILLGDTTLEDLKFNIDNADKVVTFAREDAIERLNELGIEVSKEDRKFTSIHHLMRTFTDFQREGLQTYADIVEFPLTDDNAYNIMRVYMAIVDIETREVQSDKDEIIIDSMLETISAHKPMMDNMNTLVASMNISKIHDEMEDNAEFAQMGVKENEFSKRLTDAIAKMTEGK